MKFIITIIIALFFVFQISPLVAQSQHSNIYSSGKSVLCTANEGDWLWIGTEGGLVKLNKITNAMEFFNTHNSPLPDNQVNCISIDTDGNRWLGTPAGLMNFSGEDWQEHDLSWTGLVNQNIRSICVDATGVLWLGTKDGLLEYDGGWGTLHTSPLMNLQNNYISGIVIDSNNVKWIACNSSPIDSGGNGLISFDGENWNRFNTSNSGIRSNYISSLALDSDGQLWLAHPARVGQYNTPAAGGISSFNGTNWQSYDDQNTPMLNKHILSIASSSGGTVWAGTAQGLLIYESGNWTLLQAPSIYSQNSAFSWIGIDGANTLWLGEGSGYTSGLLKLVGSNWSMMNPSNSSLTANHVNCLAVDGNSTKWIGLPILGELISIDGANWQNMNLYDMGVVYGQVNSVAFDNWGKMWLSVDNKLISWDGDTWTTHMNYLTDLGQICIDAQNVVWVAVYDEPNFGVYGGLLRYDGQVIQIFNDDNTTMPGRRIKDVAISSSGDVWVSVFGYDGTALGLCRYNGQNWTNYTSGNSALPNNQVNCLAVSMQNALWIGTPNGLMRVVGNTWTSYTTANSDLPANDVRAIAIDSDNRVWVSASYTHPQFEKSASILACLNGSMWNVYIDVIPRGRLCDIIAIDSSGNKWLASSSDALGIIDFHEAPVANEDNLQTAITPLRPSSYPNPFRQHTAISFSLNKAEAVELIIYNSKGQKVKSLCNAVLPMGTQRIEWDGTDDKGQATGQGLYLYRLQTNNAISTGKLIRLR